jgi:DNA-binding HxlR family transcriptional regulator
VERKSFSDMHCSVAQCLEVTGDWWTLLIVRDAFFGIRRFDQFQERLGISRNILNQRLNSLVENGVFDRVQYNEHPPRYEYKLTAKGRDLWPVLTAMRQWGDKHAAADGPPIRIIHKDCGKVTEAVMTCAHCGERIGMRDVEAIPGRGDLDRMLETARTVPERGM